MNYYYERSGILESKVNITYHELFCKTDEELDLWIEEVRQYIIEDWDERGIPPMIGQSIEDIKKGFRKLRDYNIRGFIEKDDDGNANDLFGWNIVFRHRRTTNLLASSRCHPFVDIHVLASI